MNERDLLALIDQKVAQSVGSGSTSDTITADREKALKYYKGEPFGDERVGSSQVVSRDVAESIDSMMPSLMKIFSSGDEVVCFEPTKETEEGAAAQATDYVNWIWSAQNEGYTNFHTWFKDGLLSKLGTLKIWWEDSTHFQREEYEGLTQGEYDALCAEEDLELVEHAEYDDPHAPPATPADAAAGMGMPAGLPGMPALPLPTPKLHDCVFRRLYDESRVRIEPVPPEETLVDRQSGANEMPWGNRRKRTIGELIEEFPDKEKEIRDLPGAEGHDMSPERQARFSDEGMQTRADGGTIDPLTREVWVVDGYFRVDFDEDGYAELRKITTAGASPGTAGVILENIEYDENPFACVSPVLMPHKLIGMSIADQTMDIQLVKSTLVRQGLNNLYLANNSEVAITGEWDLDALLNRRPGNVIRGKAGATITPLTVPGMLADILAGVQYFDQVRDQRTGAARFTAGPGADSLNNAYTQTATGVNQVETASQERIAYYARNFAETGVKRAFRRIFELVCKHHKRAKMLKLRGKWVEFNPSEWNSRMGMTVSVALGTNNKTIMVQQLLMLLTQVIAPIVQLQGGLNGPLVKAEHVHHALSKLVEAMGFRAAEQFFGDPEDVRNFQAPQPPPDPKLIAIQADLQKVAAQLAADERKTGAELASKERIAQLQAMVERELGTLKVAVENKAIDVEAAVTLRQQATDAAFRDLDGARADRQHETDTEFRRFDAQRGIEGDKRSREREDRDFYAKNPEFKMPAPPEPPPQPKPRRLTGVTLVHGADGRVAGAKRHHDDGSTEEIPIGREGHA